MKSESDGLIVLLAMNSSGVDCRNGGYSPRHSEQLAADGVERNQYRADIAAPILRDLGSNAAFSESDSVVSTTLSDKNTGTP